MRETCEPFVKGLILSVVLVLSEGGNVSSMLVDLLVDSSTVESGFLPYSYFEEFRLKRVGAHYGTMRQIAPENCRRIVLATAAAKSALAQRIQPGNLLFGAGFTARDIVSNPDELDSELLAQFNASQKPKHYHLLDLTAASGESRALLIMNPIHIAGKDYFKLFDSLLKSALQPQ